MGSCVLRKCHKTLKTAENSLINTKQKNSVFKIPFKISTDCFSYDRTSLKSQILQKTSKVSYSENVPKLRSLKEVLKFRTFSESQSRLIYKSLLNTLSIFHASGFALTNIGEDTVLVDTTSYSVLVNTNNMIQFSSNDNQKGIKDDIWQAGALSFKLLLKSNIRLLPTDDQYFSRIDFFGLSEILSLEGLACIKLMLDFDEHKRISAKTALSHIWLK